MPLSCSIMINKVPTCRTKVMHHQLTADVRSTRFEGSGTATGTAHSRTHGVGGGAGPRSVSSNGAAGTRAPEFINRYWKRQPQSP